MPTPSSISPEAHQALEALHQRASSWTLLRRSSPEPELSFLVERGELASVAALLPLALGGPEEWPTLVREAVTAIVAPRIIWGLPWLDERLRQGYLTTPPSYRPWWSLSSNRLGEVGKESVADQYLIGLCASHPNGHVREEAVRRLAQANPDVALPFLLIRVNDWVHAVRLRARTALLDRLRPANAETLVRCLPLFDRLALGRRAPHDDLRAALEQVLREPGSRPGLEAGSRSPDARIRRRCFPLLARDPVTASDTPLTRAAEDEDPAIRLWAARTSRVAGNPEVVRSLMQAAATDHSTRVRRLAFEYWQGEASPEAERLREGFLLDPAIGLRRDAQEAAQHRGLDDLAAWYRARVADERRPRRSVALAGLAETGGPLDAPVLAPFLEHRSARVRRIVLRGLDRLAEADALPHLVHAVLHDVPSVASEAVRCLSPRLGEIDPEALWSSAAGRAGEVARKRLLLLYRGLSKWSGLEFILRAIASSDAGLQALGIAELKRWHAAFNRRQLPLSPGQAPRLSACLSAVAPRIPGRLAQELRFVLQQG